ncbi:peptide synthase [Oleiharenicola lentus]|jgi:acyl-CoA synthetase (AMP-forming)/AMP-acid ligase II|uniref:Peptide synthase n=2 Tax=Oleiharenicola lentus TaxID=2508720 RepID=A0A4Q1CCK8_9BACT|nr:peptide synthase [Oleiharenicola lentus]
MAARQPDHPAVKIPRGRTRDGHLDYLTLSFRELDAEVDAWVAHLRDQGVRRGDRVLVMVRQGLPLIAAAFALFKLGAVPVIIDPGMGRKNFLACVARSQPRVLLGIPLAQILSHLFRSAFVTVEIRIWASSSATARLSQSKIENPKSKMVDSAAADLAAVLFTSGSTGAPKGVCYEHGMFEAQVRLVRDTYGIQPGEVDLPMLPIFALFNPALGMTTIVPELDPSRPATVDPAKIVQAIQEQRVTNSFGSPTLWRKIFDHCLAEDIRLTSLRRVLCAGAAVPASLWADAWRVLPNGRLHSPYGATEVLPVASVAADEVVPASVGGSLIGRVLPDNRVKIIALHEGPLPTLTDARELPLGQIGEIIVTGPTVTKAYDRLPESTAAAKIAGEKHQGSSNKYQTYGSSGVIDTSHLTLATSGADAPVWHRMGDAGYLDAQGRLWFCGRIAERVVTAQATLHTEPCEQVFRAHEQVARCALIGFGERGAQEPALVVQPKTRTEEAVLAVELRELALRHPHTAAIKRFFFHPSFPVDVRHNAKIHRLTLARWAAKQKGHEVA